MKIEIEDNEAGGEKSRKETNPTPNGIGMRTGNRSEEVLGGEVVHELGAALRLLGPLGDRGCLRGGSGGRGRGGKGRRRRRGRHDDKARE